MAGNLWKICYSIILFPTVPIQRFLESTQARYEGKSALLLVASNWFQSYAVSELTALWSLERCILFFFFTQMNQWTKWALFTFELFLRKRNGNKHETNPCEQQWLGIQRERMAVWRIVIVHESLCPELPPSLACCCYTRKPYWQLQGETSNFIGSKKQKLCTNGNEFPKHGKLEEV